MIDVHRLDREHLERAYGLDGQRLLPWPALNAPFEGAWCVLRAGTESTPHSHHEYEIFIAISGAAEVIVDDDRHPFTAGDIVRLAPGSTHRVVNNGSADFEYYGVWWDDEMSAKFAARHAGMELAECPARESAHRDEGRPRNEVCPRSGPVTHHPAQPTTMADIPEQNTASTR